MIDFKKPSGPLLLILYVVLAMAVSQYVFFGSTELDTYAVNKTVGWAFDMCSLVILSAIASILVFLIGYAILSLFRTRVNRLVSITHTAIMVMIIYLSLISDIYNKCLAVQILLVVIAIIFLFINIGWAIRYKLIDKKRNN